MRSRSASAAAGRRARCASRRGPPGTGTSAAERARSSPGRQRLRNRALRLLDLCTDWAARAGDLDEEERCLERAIELAPEEERYPSATRRTPAPWSMTSACSRPPF
ncbi:MAG TPA: hypothetical protein VN969_28010 [Streptosporangiaceae bacterium]|nr:hypothetical protein [Streptosporangiaceae bacterium]